ncbi:hypothetical protein Sj15T_09640 [Sphingobium sp. TA15]|uniref:ATP-binding protein n=1 Tax=Sphingobium indicum (strain DSM 16413 / CCM 7287 / MTCC 6362 / UT26 / NBRC 101211 / UT26S) TaxID=452662 RepID=D4Z227_SPHIU|nr:ATP-binding protein [Sphingobium indicum]BAI96659.1 hypothetical protein SJA_C1-18250 [Sphingobium indicum UT26S]BDD65943.1 hypothetical protein Sj15T_09640 [Sphingobium sp. TA15]
MSLPSSITPCISQDALSRVSRFYSGGPEDAIAEILQNSRRAGASCVDIDLLNRAGHPVLTIRDDGIGIDDPAALLALGHSGWGDKIAQAEDPAGMGVFSLAGLRVEYRSYSHSAKSGWRVIIDGDAWSHQRPIAIEPFDHSNGTEIHIDMPEAWESRGFERVVEQVARYYPLRVFWQGTELDRADWLADAHFIEQWESGRIGVYRNRHRHLSGEPTINFHGLTVRATLPHLSEVDGARWTVLYDVGPISPLQLVLPARKDVIQTASLDALKTACQAAIFRAIAAESSHRLSHEDWLRAANLDISLPAADSSLNIWIPPVADYRSRHRGSPLRCEPMIVIDELEPDLAQSASRAIGDGSILGGRLVDAEPRFAGYDWYDELPRIIDFSFTVRRGDTIFQHSETDRFIGEPSGSADAILLEPVFADARAVSPIAAGILIMKEPYGCDDLSDPTIILGPQARFDVAALTSLLEDAAFCPSDDKAADSYETQRAYFVSEARQVAAELLLGEDKAILLQLEDILRNHRWMIPEQRTVSITVSRNEITLAYIENTPPSP